ncbi:MAG: transposase [Deltaproteobacteria bacterium]|nr:transposase [Deltaproteobacteria bacterium]
MNRPYTMQIRKKLRLKWYDYSQAGGYFVTICARDRACLFGRVIGGKMEMNEAGKNIESVWKRLPERFPQIKLDEFVIMPNHIHGILIIDGVGAIHELPLPRRRQMTLPMAMGFLKMNTSKHINNWRKTPGLPVWQRNYYEHIIRDERDLVKIREYIANNPLKWDEDPENPCIQRV